MHSAPDLIVVLDDRAAALMLRIDSETSNPDWKNLMRRSLGETRNYASLMSRAGFIEAARDAGVLAPAIRAITCEASLDSALRDIGFPAVLKADGSWGGDGIVIVHDRDEALAAYMNLSNPPSRLRSVARAMRRNDGHFLLDAVNMPRPTISLQAFIAGIPATSAFACWEGDVLAANHLEAVATQGATGPASVLRRIDNEQMDQAAARMAACFGLSGLHGLDYVKDARGNMHLIEINPRAPQATYLSFGPAHDLAAALVSKIAEHRVIERPRIGSDTVALFPQEWSRDPMSPWLKAAYHDVPWDDPALIRAWVQSKAGAVFRGLPETPESVAFQNRIRQT